MSYQSSVALSQVLIIDPLNPTTQISCGSSGSIGGGGTKSDQENMAGGVRGYGSGRIRVVTQPITTREHQLVLRLLTDPQVQQARRWRGTVLLFRDTYGRRLFGSYLDTDVRYIPLSGGLADVAIAVKQVSYNEAV